MNFSEVLYARRSVRSYASRPVGEAIIKDLLLAAVQAPSAMNAQPWRFAVVQDKAQLARFSKLAKALLLKRTEPEAKQYAPLLSEPSFDIFYDASTLIVIGVDEKTPFSEADCWLAAGNLMLAACERGLGTCCIGFALPLLASPEVKTELGFAPSGAALAAIIVGYPRGDTVPIPRHPPRILSWTR